MAQHSKRERLEEFFRRLTAAPRAASAEEALQTLAEVLDAVEDELTDIPYRPENWESDGRMYRPQEDSSREVAEHPNVTRYRSVGHNTFVAQNGAIEIRQGKKWKRAEVVFEKPGANGNGVWEAT